MFAMKNCTIGHQNEANPFSGAKVIMKTKMAPGI